MKSFETILGKNKNLRERYSETIESGLKKGCVSKLETSHITSNIACWYLHHHLVVNPNKPGKMQRVFNAAGKFRSNSLNDVLLIGTDLLRSLCGIVIRFREKSVVLSADIEEMFFHMEVEVDDRNYLLFLWRCKQCRRDIFLERSCHQHVLILLFSCAQKTSKTTLERPTEWFSQVLVWMTDWFKPMVSTKFLLCRVNCRSYF